MEAVAGLLAATEGGENSEASSRLVIHVYSKLAKLHKHGVIPYLPRIMASVVASLSCSPQLHSACTQVVASLASHTIDPARDPASNEDALRSLCRPLLSAVSSPQPPLLATGAAACLQALVESDRWRCAPLDLQELICVKGIQALTKEGMRTVAHMCLMRSLAEFSSSVVIQGYGARLLSAGMEILQSSSGMAESWQKRVAAAQLLESVLKIADAELLDLDLSPIVGVLQDCQLDRVAGVRTAVAGALRTASLFASLDAATSHSTNPVTALHPPSDKHIAQQSVLGLQVQSDMGPLNPSTPSHGTVFGSTPSSHKSAKCLKRLPLLPLQQSPVANPTLVTSRRRPGALKPSDYKENVPPANYSELQGSSRHSLRDVRMSKKISPMFRATSHTMNSHCENLSLFNSPQMPIFSFSGEGDSTVLSLCEKRSGKVNGGIEDQFCLSTLGRGTVENNYRMSGQKFTSLNNMIGCTSDETHRCVEEHYRDGESCNIFGENQDGSRSTRSTEVKLGNGLESPPDEECDCNSIVSSEHEPNLQVAKNQSFAEDLLITPKGLICCSLQFDDMHHSDLEQENSMNSDVEMSSETGWGMCEDPDTGESEADGYDEYSTIDTASQESNVTSSSPCSFLEKSDLSSERDTQGNKRSEGKIRWRGGVMIGDDSDMEVAGLSPMSVSSSKYSSYSFSDKDKTMEYHNHVVDGKVDGGRKLPVFVDDQIKPLNSELKSIVEKTLSSVFLKLLRKARSFIGTTFAIVILCAAATWVTRYLGDLQELNVLVPT